MNGPVRILYVDDYPLDRELVRDVLEKEDGGFEIVEAASRADFETALAQGGFDLILSDFNILGFEGLQVLEAVHANDSNLPVIIVTGTGSEEVAAESIKRGAADYILKSPKHIQRLPHTIHAVLEKKQLEDKRRQAEDALHESEERYRLLFENSGEAILLTKPDGSISSANPEACRIFGRSEDEIRELGRDGVVVANDPHLQVAIDERRRTGQFKGELNLLRKDGSTFPGEVTSTIFTDSRGDERTSMIIRDITERKQAEERINRQLQHLTALSVIDRVISANFDPKLTLSEILIHVTKELGTDAADILILNSGLQMLEFCAGCGFHSKGDKKAPVRWGGRYAGRVAQERQLVQISNLGEEPESSRLAPHMMGEDFVFYIGVPLIIKGQAKGVLETFHRAALKPDAEWIEFLNALAGQAAIAIENSILFESQQRSNSDLFMAYDATIEGWSRALDLRDRETEGHSKRVTEHTVKLAQEFGISEVELVHVRWGALLHDIGKMGVPDGILLKPGPLTDEEWVIMKKHPSLAYELLAPIDYLRQALDIPYCHHEKWDGSGYPRGLKGDQIPLSARAFAVVDVWDALTSDRPYRAAWPESKTLPYIREQAGKHFDPKVVETFLQQKIDADR